MRPLRLRPDRLVVSEVFESLQGEGPSVGRPSTFLRLGWCNLACTWCDTPYTWDARRFSLADELRSVPLSTLLRRLEGAPNLVITGGEPLLQQEALAALLREYSGRVEVETAGTLTPIPALLDRVDQWNVSPKLGSSGNAPHKRRVDAALRTFAQTPRAAFKFVVVGEEDLAEADALVSDLGVEAGRVWLMPEGVEATTLLQRSGWLAGACAERGYHLGVRLHVLLWGDRRGV